MPEHEAGEPEQLALIGPRGGLLPRPAPRRGPRREAATDPVAQVVLDSPLPRLDRVFEYRVPAALHSTAVLGAKVRVPFGGRRIEGWVVGRSAQPAHPGDLQWIGAVAAAEPALTPETLQLFRRVAEHYLGTLPDVIRLAVPPRRAEAAQAPAAVPLPVPAAPPDAALRSGPGRWIWTCPPGTDWAVAFAHTLAATAAGGGRGLAVVPDGRALRRLAGALSGLLPPACFAVLTASGSPAERYGRFRAVLEGAVPLVVGTRSASLAPLSRPDVLLLWDDGDDSHAERRAPYPHAREVLAMRSRDDTAFIVGSYARSTNAQRWLAIGYAQQLGPGPAALRRSAPRVVATDDESGPATPGQRSARLPPHAGAAIRRALAEGPVLVCVGRTGYVPRLACADCRAPADCAACGGALGITSSHAVATCGRCGRPAGDWHCPACSGRRMRSVAVGSSRTAEELGRAFPGVPVVVSSGERIVEQVGADPALVVATPGAEPFPAAGYAAVVVLDVTTTLALPGLRSGEQAARRWFGAGALARPGAPMIVVAAPDVPMVQALVRWDPGWLAARELAQREQAGMPPARKAVALTGAPEDLADFRSAAPAGTAVLGPVPDGQRERLLLLAPHRAAAELLQRVRAVIVRRSAERAGPVAVQVDPADLT